MKRVVLFLVLSTVLPARARAQAAPPADRTAQAYEQFLLAHYYEDQDKTDEAIAAYKRAMALDPSAAEIPAELASLYMHENRASEAINTAEQALKIDPKNREAHRVLGLVFGAIAQMGRESSLRPIPGEPPNESLTKAISHLEQAVANPVGEADPTARATLARLYVRGGFYEKAIPLLTELVNQEPGWSDGPMLLAEAYSAAGRNGDAIKWLEEAVPENPELLPTLADFYERERRWTDAAKTYGAALEQSPNSRQLKMRYASALINTSTRSDIEKAREVLNGLLEANATDTRALYLLSQTERRLGDVGAAETTARKMIAQDSKTPWGYYALAEALEERHQYQAVIDELSPAIDRFRNRRSTDKFELTMLLPHVGFAYQQLQQYDKAIAAFEEAHKVAPSDENVTAYLIDAEIAAKKYSDAIALAQSSRAGKPPDVRLARLEARALHLSGKDADAVALLESVVKARPDDAAAYVALAQLYVDSSRAADAVALLETARTKLPAEDDLTFELGAVLDKQKRYTDAEATFRQLLAHDPDNAAALNYLGYMLADRGERLDESVRYLKKAVQLEPDNGSYLDSLGWAYFKSDKLDLAESNLRRAAEQLGSNSVVQDHYGELLFKLGRYDEAISAWNRALNGDGDSIDAAAIEKKIQTARSKLKK